LGICGAEALARGGLQARDAGQHFLAHAVRHVTVLHVMPARIGGDGEAWRYGDADPRHLGQIRALAAQQVLRPLVTIRLPVAEVVDPLSAHDSVLPAMVEENPAACTDPTM
jgi:hypothetical protein